MVHSQGFGVPHPMGIKLRKTRIEMRLNHRGTENTEILGRRRVVRTQSIAGGRSPPGHHREAGGEWLSPSGDSTPRGLAAAGESAAGYTSDTRTPFGSRPGSRPWSGNASGPRSILPGDAAPRYLSSVRRDHVISTD